MYQEFYLSITPIEGDEYLVRTTQLPPDIPEAVETVNWPVQDWLATLPADSSRVSGQILYEALFQKSVLKSWQLMQHQANQTHSNLAVHLALDDEQLLYLPWENLEEYYRSLGSSTDVSFFHFYNDYWEEESWEETLPRQADGIVVEQGSEKEPAYEEDSAVVADLFRQLTQAPTSSETPLHPQSPSTSEQHSAELVTIDRSNAIPSEQLSYSPAASSSPILVQHWLIRSTVVVAILGILVLLLPEPRLLVWQRMNSQSDLLSENSGPEGLPASSRIVTNFKKADLQTVQTLAIRSFQQGNWSIGQQAIEALLDRNALSQAEAALEKLPPNSRQSAEITFLRGRLVWQSIREGQKKYKLTDAQRYWEAAIKQEPNNPLYYTALGFAYYTEGKLALADRAWFQALFLLEERQANGKQASSSQTAADRSASNRSKDMATAYAGLTLALVKSASQQPSDQQASLLGRAQKIYREVISEHGREFTAEELQKEWLWQPQVIQDWLALSKRF